MYSLWLKPSIESFRRYQSIISDLAEVNQTEDFLPHITLKSNIEDLTDKHLYDIAVLSAITKVFDVRSTSLSVQDDYYKSLYAVVQHNTILNHLNREIKDLFPNNDYDFQPHISLIYSNLSKVKKLKIIQLNRKTYPKLIGLEGIQIMKTVGKPSDWEMIEYFPFHD